MQNKLKTLLIKFDEILGSIGTEYIEDENEEGKCHIEVNTISDIDLEDLRKIYDELERLHYEEKSDR